MNPSPLQLEKHFFTRVQIGANPAGKAEVGNELNCQVELSKAADDPRRFELILRLKLMSPPKEEACYTGEIHAVGLFRVVKEWPEGKVLALVEANGAALLYGAIRELVFTITARGPWAAVDLPSVTFVQPKAKPQVAAPAAQPEGAKTK